MAFPAGLTLISVHAAFDIPPDGGATGSIRFSCRYPLTGATDNSIVPPWTTSATLDADGECTVQLPATNDPDWTPVDWAYDVVISVGSATVHGTLQLDYQTASVQLADLLQIDGTAQAGTSYIPLGQLGAPGGVATLDGSGDLTASQLPTHTHTAAQVTDLQPMLDAKAPLASPTFTGTVSGISKSMVGLGNVDNTSDVNKPVSTAQAAAIAQYHAALPTDHGLVGWTFDPDGGVFGATLLPAAGTMKVVKIRAMSSVVTNILLHFTVGGGTLSNCYAALYTDAGALVGIQAVTADQSTTGSNWQAGGLKVCPLLTPQAVTPGAIYRVGWWWNGTTAPTMSRGSASGSAIVNVNQSASTARNATANTGLTSSAPSNLASLAGDTTAWWVGLS